MRVLFITDFAIAHTGPHTNVVSSLNALSAHRKGIKIRLLCNEIDETESFVNDDSTIIKMGYNPHSVFGLFKNLQLIRQEIKKADLIYVPTGLKNFLYAWLNKQSKPLVAGPNVTGIPGLMDIFNPSPLMTMKMADAWIEMSEVRIRECIHAGTPRNYINFVPHGLNLEKFGPQYKDPLIWEREGVTGDNFKILHVGRATNELKGIRKLMEAWRLLQQDGLNADLILVVKPGSELTKEDKKMPNVYYLGPRYGKNLSTIYASSDLFVGASRYETFWYAPMEAMASGTATIATPVGAVPSMIPEDGNQGCIANILDSSGHQFRKDAPERLASLIREVIENDEKRESMAKNGRKHIQVNFNERILGKRLVKVFQETLAKYYG